MPDRDWTIFIRDIHYCASKILNYTNGLNREDFFSDSRTYDAVMRNLQIIGEASKKLSAEIKRKYKNIEWKKITGLRDIVVHDYSRIDEDIIWDVVHSKIPKLKLSIESILKDISHK
jgi:uncharacterized protein with HEPN domain